MEIPAKEADCVFKIVDNVLKQVVGEKATLLIYKYMESRYSLQPSEFATKFDLFSKGLESFLSSGASIIERRIIEEIRSKGSTVGGIKYAKLNAEQSFANQVVFTMPKMQAICFL